MATGRVVEANDLFEAIELPGLKVRRGTRDVPQRWDLEGTTRRGIARAFSGPEVIGLARYGWGSDHHHVAAREQRRNMTLRATTDETPKHIQAADLLGGQ